MYTYSAIISGNRTIIYEPAAAMYLLEIVTCVNIDAVGQYYMRREHDLCTHVDLYYGAYQHVG